MKATNLLWTAIVLSLNLTVAAQTTLPDSALLQEVTISAVRIPTTQLQSPLAVTVLNDSWIRKGQQQLTLQEALSAVPGLYISNTDNFTQDLRIAVRGFGARSAFGIRGVKLLVDGLPETTADGQGQVDNIDPGTLQRIEILRGPAAALYGNASGGVITMTTDSIAQVALLNTRISMGHSGMQQYRLKTSNTRGNWGYTIQASHQQLKGFREHSQLSSLSLNSKIAYKKNIQLIINFVNSPVANDAGALTIIEAELNPKAARIQNVQFNAGENLTQGKIGITGKQTLSNNTSINYYGFSLFRDFNNRLPIQSSGIVYFFRSFAGTGIAINHKFKKSTLRCHLDYEFQTDSRQRYNNENGIRGILRVNQTEQFGNLATGAQWQWNPSTKWQIQTALRSDLMQQKIKDRFLSDADDSGSTSYFNVNPMLGASFQLRPATYWFATYATAFETPTMTELANPDGNGGFNPDLQPQKSVSLETGIKGRLKGLQYELAIYQINAANEIIPFEIDSLPNRTFYQNAGRTSRSGLEIGLLIPVYGPLTTRIAWNSGHYIYKKAAQEANNGAFLPGLPVHHGMLAVQYMPENAFFAVIQSQYTSKLFANDANTIEVKPLLLLSGRMGYLWNRKKSKLQFFLGGNNLTNSAYFSNIRINAAFGRYYEPGPSRQLFGGLELHF